MSEPSVIAKSDAGKRYQSARRKAIFDELFGLVRGRAPELLSFEQVQNALQAWQQVEGRQPQVIPLDKIVGSVGRYKDFTREFLPKDSIDEARWRAVDTAMHSQVGLPPIEVYQIGEIYFVKDGNHRVSVARANGLRDIEAYVTRVETPVPMTADTWPEDLALKAAYADFLRQTHLEDLRPDAEVEVTEFYSYTELLEHICVHRYYMGLEQEREISWDEAVISWYDHVYLPVTAAIWASDILEKFPGRTAADLYLWVSRHREDLAQEGGAFPTPVQAVTDLSEEEGDAAAGRVVDSVKKALGAKPKDANLAAEAAKATPRGPSQAEPPADDTRQATGAS
jgi:hypothetical protein